MYKVVRQCGCFSSGNTESDEDTLPSRLLDDVDSVNDDADSNRNGYQLMDAASNIEYSSSISN